MGPVMDIFWVQTYKKQRSDIKDCNLENIDFTQKATCILAQNYIIFIEKISRAEAKKSSNFDRNSKRNPLSKKEQPKTTEKLQ